MKKLLYVLCLVCMVISACTTSTKSDGPTHFPFKESQKDKWGLVDANGKVLVSDEFKARPTSAINGMFFVEQDNGYEMYSVKNPLLPIGDTYKSVVAFTSSISPSVREGEGIKYIDKVGNVKFELPLDITYATNFVNGYSLITKKESGTTIVGAFSLTGESKFFPDFNILQVLSDGSLLASKVDDRDLCLLDSQGKVKVDYKSTRIVFSKNEKYCIYYDDSNFGVKTKEGETIIKAKYPILSFTDDGNLIFADDDERYGIMNLKNEVLIKPRYTMIIGCQDGLFIASKDGETLGLLNMKEERVIDFKYSSLFFMPNSKNLYAERERDKYVYIIDRKNNEIAEYAELEAGNSLWYFNLLDEYSNYSSVKSDYFDVSDCVKSLLHPSTDGVDRSIDELYNFAGLGPEDCAMVLGMDLTKDDIINDVWFPYKNLVTNDYGTISYGLGFSAGVVETYYDEYDYWELHPHYSYANHECDYIRVKLQMNSETMNHKDQIEKQIENVLVAQGYSKSTNSSKFGNPMYSNSKIVLEVIFDYDNLVLKAYTNY